MPQMVACKISAERLRELFSYDPETGIFVSLKRRGHILPGTKSGYDNAVTDRYKRKKICIDWVEYPAHRLAWLYVYGEWPKGTLDHINADPTDNRICNLREATQRENMANSKKPKTNKSGYKGVSWHAIGKKWQAHIKTNGINRYLGLFNTVEEAHEAYKQAAQKYNGEFARAA